MLSGCIESVHTFDGEMRVWVGGQQYVVFRGRLHVGDIYNGSGSEKRCVRG